MILRLTLLVLLSTAAVLAWAARSWEVDILRETFAVTLPEQIDAPLEEVMQGCPRRDCIPSIDRPDFLAVGQSGMTSDEDLVMGVRYGGEARAYPIHILNLHEVVNDRIGELAFAVTWCPLCGSGLVFDRTLDGKAVEFGVSGLLYNSDLILYDRQTASLWQQITGRAIAGTRRGQTLRTLPVSLTSWGEWRAAHPDTRLLSTRTGHERDYSRKQPYGDYDSSERLLFPARAAPGLRLHPKTVIHGLQLRDTSVAISERALQDEGRVTLQLEDIGELTVERGPDGTVQAWLGGSEHRLTVHRMFWFAWASFHPGTVLYDPQGQRGRKEADE